MTGERTQRHITESRLTNGTYRGISDRTYAMQREIAGTCPSVGEMRNYMLMHGRG